MNLKISFILFLLSLVFQCSSCSNEIEALRQKLENAVKNQGRGKYAIMDVTIPFAKCMNKTTGTPIPKKFLELITPNAQLYYTLDYEFVVGDLVPNETKELINSRFALCTILYVMNNNAKQRRTKMYNCNFNDLKNCLLRVVEGDTNRHNIVKAYKDIENKKKNGIPFDPYYWSNTIEDLSNDKIEKKYYWML